MSAFPRRELLCLEPSGDVANARLASPSVGYFQCWVESGALLLPGQVAGRLTTLGVVCELVVPANLWGANSMEGGASAGGLVRSTPPRRTREPVAYLQVLFELEHLATGTAGRTGAGSTPHAQADSRAQSRPSLRSPQTGRFYHRGAPGEPSMCEVGRDLVAGTPIGLIEVMKTFTQVVYQPGPGLPERARILRVIARDGADVDEGAALIEVEPRAG